jgi:hypothetical protein
LNKKTPIENFLKILTGIVFFTVITVSAQEKTNLGVFNELVDSSVAEVSAFIPDSVKVIDLELNNGPLSVFNAGVISSLSKRGYKLVNGTENLKLAFIIDEASTSYGEIYRDGFLGEYYVPRRIILSGDYNITRNTVLTHSFNFAYQDTVNVDSVTSLENAAYPFTQGKLPAEPFFSGILEPVIAVGTAALAVILFFTIRSK